MAEADISKVKGNVAKMIAAGAPETDIDAYIAGEGTTADTLRSAPVTAAGLAKAAGSGLAKGVTAIADSSPIGIASNAVIHGAGAAANYAADNLGMESLKPVAEKLRSFDVNKIVGDAVHKPENKAEEYASTVGEMAPAVVAGPGGIVRRTILQVVLPGIASQAAGDIPGVKGTAAEPYVRAAAAVASPIAAERAITPLTTAPTRAAAVQNLRAEGVDVSAGQSTGSKFLRKAEEELGGSTTQTLAERQSEQFTAAVARRFGTQLDEHTPRLTQGVVQDAFDRVGGNINQLAANNVLVHDGHLTNAVNTAVRDYNDLVPPSLRSPLVERIEQAVNHQTGGVLMDGEQYQSLRSRLGALARGSRQEPERARAIYGLQNALDDAMERSIQALNPQSLGEWQAARTQYRNLLIADRALSKTSEAASSGLVTPQALSEAVKAVGGRADLTRGRGDLSVLARNGSEVMATLANSNTASRNRIHSMLAVPGALVGGFGAHGLGPEAALGAAVMGAAVPRAVGEGLIRGRRYLGNTALPGRQTFGSSALRGILGSQQ